MNGWPYSQVVHLLLSRQSERLICYRRGRREKCFQGWGCFSCIDVVFPRSLYIPCGFQTLLSILNKKSLIGTLKFDNAVNWLFLRWRQMFKCLTIFKRTDDILEIQEGSPTIHQVGGIQKLLFDKSAMIG